MIELKTFGRDWKFLGILSSFVFGEKSAGNGTASWHLDLRGVSANGIDTIYLGARDAYFPLITEHFSDYWTEPILFIRPKVHNAYRQNANLDKQFPISEEEFVRLLGMSTKGVFRQCFARIQSARSHGPHR